MPLLRRRPVQLLPLPNLDGLASDAPVFYLKATGEIFLDYDAYAARLTFLLSRQFQCEYSGKTNLDYFSALQSEKAESRIVRERFPDPLKGRVLGTVQFRVMGRLDSLVDLVFERYKDRFFAGEKVFVDLQGDKYFARIAKLFPPQSVRDAGAASSAPTASTSSAPADPADEYATVAHKIGCDLNVDAGRAKREDDPNEYLYTVQLMDEEHKFEGSFMEVKAKQLSRDRLAFSKSIMKRYLRECLIRDPAIGSPWIVKPSIARAFGIPQTQSEGEASRNEMAREAKLAKRRKGGDEPGTPGAAAPAPSKKRKTADGSATPAAAADSGAASTPKPAEGPKKTIKYPIEDLDLDAMSIIDGRVLRRVNADIPDLPVKPQPRKDLLVPPEHFDRFIETWNMLNVFSKPLSLSTFSLDDYAGALTHATSDPRCTLLVEIHASLTNVIGTDTSRVLGSTTAVTSHGFGRGAVAGASGGDSGAGGAGTPMKEEANPLEVDQLAEGSPAPAAEPEAEGGDAAADLAAYEHSELNRLVRLGITFGKRWDRQAKLKYKDGREGWEHHLVGALCQRGGPVYLERFVEIMRWLFRGHPRLPPRTEEPGEEGEGVKKEELGEGEGAKKEGEGAAEAAPKKEKENGTTKDGDADDEEAEDDDADEPEDTSNVAAAYLSLPMGDKLDIVAYLCTLVMGSKAIRSYVDECDSKLTELRKERAEVNKEKKALAEQKAIIEAGGTPTMPVSGSSLANGNGHAGSDVAMDVDSRPASEAGDPVSTPRPSSARPPASTAGGDDDEEDQLASDAESTAAASEAGSTLSQQVSRRQAQLEEKRLEKLAGGGGGSTLDKLREAAKQKTKGVIARATVEDKLRTNAERDDAVEREFRRFQNVARCRPLGKDRFHCRYWWFDGVGGMELVDRAGEAVYGTGRLLVQGPSWEDWELIADLKGKGDEGEKAMLERRRSEEVAEEADQLLGVNEWAWYETEDELDALIAWLNSKGTRELALKNAIAKWRPRILAGAEKRRFDAAHPELPRYEIPEPPSGRRSSRAVKQEPQPNTYMGYLNHAHKY
ncbi:hypothetical protein JCM10207_001527 [Rhodosporidiobolus poonsookiae]